MRFKRAGFLTKIVVLVLLIYLATSLLDLRGSIQVIQGQRNELAQQVTDQKLINQELAAAIENKDDPEVQEKVMEDKGFVKEDQILFKDISRG